MANRYLSKKLKLPKVNDLHELASTMIKELPEKTDKTTIEFVTKYFQCKKKGEEFVWDPTNSQKAQRHSEYPRSYLDIEAETTDEDGSPKTTGELGWQ